MENRLCEGQGRGKEIVIYRLEAKSCLISLLISVSGLMTLPPSADLQHAILVLHLAYEIFVLVGPDARERRRDIRLGMSLAQVQSHRLEVTALN